jgi:hypothetical protein
MIWQNHTRTLEIAAQVEVWTIYNRAPAPLFKIFEDETNFIFPMLLSGLLTWSVYETPADAWEALRHSSHCSGK